MPLAATHAERGDFRQAVPRSSRRPPRHPFWAGIQSLLSESDLTSPRMTRARRAVTAGNIGTVKGDPRAGPRRAPTRLHLGHARPRLTRYFETGTQSAQRLIRRVGLPR